MNCSSLGQDQQRLSLYWIPLPLMTDHWSLTHLSLTDQSETKNKKILEEEFKREEEERQQQQQQQQDTLQQQPGIQNRRRNRRRRARARNLDCNCRGGPQNCPLGGKCLIERRVLSMLGRLQDWTTLMRRGTQVYMRDPLKPDIMGTKATSETGNKNELD